MAMRFQLRGPYLSTASRRARFWASVHRLHVLERTLLADDEVGVSLVVDVVVDVVEEESGVVGVVTVGVGDLDDEDDDDFLDDDDLVGVVVVVFESCCCC